MSDYGRAAEAKDPGTITLVLYNLLYWPYLLTTSAILFGPALVLFLATFLWDKHVRVLHRYTTWWGAHLLRYAPFVDVRVEGKERLVPKKAYVYVANHQSMVDILAVFCSGLDFKWVSKIENFFVPFIGWNMILNRYIHLNRGKKPSIVRMYKTCDAWIKDGISVFMFPEGTRSPDGEIKEFFMGAFKIACTNGTPIAPMLIEGTGKILPKGRFRIAPHPVTIRMLEPIDPADVGGDPQRLHDLVRARMLEEQDRMRGRSHESAA